MKYIWDFSYSDGPTYSAASSSGLLASLLLICFTVMRTSRVVLVIGPVFGFPVGIGTSSFSLLYNLSETSLYLSSIAS